MIREVDLSEISDGKTYRSGDTVKIGTMGCSGCSSCCHEVEDTIKLDPMDIWRLESGPGLSFRDLLAQGKIQLQVVDGLIIPNLSVPDKKSGCTFLDAQERCSIHAYRPGFCRLFPLGRIYDESGDFRYFIQIHECARLTTKVKIRKWLDIPDLASYEEYIRRWHRFCRDAQRVTESISTDGLRTKVCTRILETFYADPWTDGNSMTRAETEKTGPAASASEREFYEQFDARLAGARRMIGLSPE